MRRVIISLVAALGVIATALVPMRPEPAAAANAALFNPGYIISDALFYDGGAMNASGVQTFLQQRVTSCTAGYVCLKDYRQNTPTMPADSYCAGTYQGAANERAADIIAKIGAACRISQAALLVLLEKEQGLVSSRAPSQSRYDHATGFSCPDTAPCDPAFAGFFYQVYYAARQFQKYAATPTSWNYQAGRYNNILYHPNRACGTGSVYIQNKATAGLYIYTPYQPNAAALGNLYGSGDGCSSYGNRNFWRIYSDWFGSPTEGSSLLRTTANATVYLVTGSTKHPVPDIPALTALATLGPVGYVSQSYLDVFPTAHPVGRTIRDPGGTIYFFDSGIKLPLSSCALAADYGASCEASGYVQLEQYQANAFATGPTLTNLLGTAEGGRYYIKDGTKAEILDAQSQADAGITGAMNVLTENAISRLAVASPIARDGVFVQTRSTSEYALLLAGERYLVPSGSATPLGITTRSAGSLTSASLAKLTTAAVPFTGAVSIGTETQVLSASGRYVVAAPGALLPTAVPVAVPDQITESYPLLGSIGVASFFRSTTYPTVFAVMPDSIRPVDSWESLVQLTPNGQPVILWVAPSVVALFKQGPVTITSGRLVRSPGNATVWLVDGVSSKIPLTSFIEAAEAGFYGFIYAGQSRIDAYPSQAKPLSYGIVCGNKNYVAAGGSIHEVSADLLPEYPFHYTPFDLYTCGRLKIGAPATSLIRTPNGTIYYLADGAKHWISSMAQIDAVAPGQAWLNVRAEFANLIPSGPKV